MRMPGVSALSYRAALSITEPVRTPIPDLICARNVWAVLLAGGDGVRLRDLTMRIVGDCRPKQFCPIAGGETLLRQTRSRLDPVFSSDRQVFVVSRSHERYYAEELADASDAMVIPQPSNCGTAVGILIALLRVMQSDPDAVVGFFPCDHYYSDDNAFRTMVGAAVASAGLFPQSIVVVGAEPHYPETEYGWIEPGSVVAQTNSRSLCKVSRFVEKPALADARALMSRACLWNTFVTISRADTLLELIFSEIPEVVLAVTRALAENDLVRVYATLPSVDFSRDILSHHAESLLVLRDCSSGWADLGGPARVLDLVARNLIQPAWLSRVQESAQ